MAKKNIMVHAVSCFVLCVEFLLCRYVFFELHGMKDWPLVLFLFSFAVIGISFFVKAQFVPVFTSFSYIVGFAAGVIFQTDRVNAGGERTNNLWKIWTVIVVCAVISSALGEIIEKKFHQANDCRNGDLTV